MLIIPAIDMRQGHCVRLKQGEFTDITYYQAKPQQLVHDYLRQGAQRLHVVDLDGAKSGEIAQLSLIKSLVDSSIKVQCGGGIRSLASAQRCLEAGVDWIVLGSLAITNPTLTKELIDYCGNEHIILAFDIRMDKNLPKLAVHGWQTTTELDLWQAVDCYQQWGINTILCTDIACDGMLAGPNFNLYQQALQQFPKINWQASGGIRHQQDLEQLASIGLSAAILGRLLYETDFDLGQALQGVVAC